MSKRDVYELSLLKVQQEQTKLELILREKNLRKKELEKILQVEDELKERVKRILREEREISPSFILLNKQIHYSDKQRIQSHISAIEREVFTLKKEYLRIKNRRDKIIEQKEKKDIEVKELKASKEFKLIQSDFISKKFLEKEGGYFEN